MPDGAHGIEVGRTADGLWMAGAAGRSRLSQISPTVVRIDIEGHAYAEFVELIQSSLDQLVRTRGRLYLGIDAEGMRSYDSRFRYLWTEWIKANERSIDGLLFLYRSRIVESVAVIINAVTGGELVQGFADRDEFEDRLAAAVSCCRRTVPTEL